MEYWKQNVHWQNVPFTFAWIKLFMNNFHMRFNIFLSTQFRRVLTFLCREKKCCKAYERKPTQMHHHSRGITWKNSFSRFFVNKLFPFFAFFLVNEIVPHITKSWMLDCVWLSSARVRKMMLIMRLDSVQWQSSS
jgi:hypothetical protein